MFKGDELFGILHCSGCSELFPLGNYFPRVPDLRPRELRIRVFKEAWFKALGVPAQGGYVVSARGLVELPYYVSLLLERYEDDYHGRVEERIIGELRRCERILCVGCGDGRELRLLGRSGLGVDISPSSVVLCNSRGVRALLADLLHLPFSDEVFDGLLALEVLEYVPGRGPRER